ncbi:MAG: ribonuclease Y [Patescibacteria group bacterium]
MLITIILSVLVVGLGGFTTYKQLSFTKNEQKLKDDLKKAKEDFAKVKEEENSMASTKAQEIILDAKNKAFDIIKNSETKEIEIRKLASETEQKIRNRQKDIDERSSRFESQERKLERDRESLVAQRSDLEKKLEEISSLTKDNAKALLLEQLDKELINEKAKRIKEFEDEIRAKSEDISKEVLIETMQKTVSEYIGPATTSIVDIPNDDVKGRIIGKEGRNIKYFEKLTGVDLIIDDMPGSITVSCFDPLRREVGIIALRNLIEDKRIHPGKIEELVKKAKEDLSKEIRKFGEKIAYDAGITGLRPELILLLGRMKYRYSYGQNLATHSLEMVQIAENLAISLNADVYMSKKCALFHDIGKVITAEQEGSHVELGAEIARKYNLEEQVINAIFAHHDMAEPTSVESAITKVADKISGGRPGARNNSSEMYSTRIKQLEDTVKSFEGVEEAYAIYAGREVRVIVKPDIVDDARLALLSHEIAEKVQKENTYPGTVQITLIRETRAVSKAS